MILRHNIIGPLIKELNDKNIFIVSDLHLNHDKEFLYGARGFNSCAEYTDYCLDQLYNLAINNKDSYLISLGDNIFNDASADIIKIFSTFPFKKIYTLTGNHCSGLNTIFGGTSNNEYENLALLGSNIPLRISKKCYVWLSHFPIMYWDHAALGVLCGHCHGGSPHLNADDSSFGKIFDCGVDNALKLKNRIYFTLEECLDILRKKEKYNDLQLHAKRKAEEHFKDDPDNEGTLSDNHSGITGFWQNDFGEGGFESV